MHAVRRLCALSIHLAYLPNAMGMPSLDRSTFRLYIQAERASMRDIVLMSIAGAFITICWMGIILSAFTWLRQSRLELLGAALVFGGVAGWSWREVYILCFLRRHPDQIYLAVTDTDFICQTLDALCRLRKLTIPLRDILQVKHGNIPDIETDLSTSWQIYLRYRDVQGRIRRRWINYDKFFPSQDGMRLIRMLAAYAQT